MVKAMKGEGVRPLEPFLNLTCTLVDPKTSPRYSAFIKKKFGQNIIFVRHTQTQCQAEIGSRY